MLIAVNMFNYMHSSYIYNYINADIDKNLPIYILDTEDLVVESIDYNNLYEYIKDETIVVQNINYDEENDCLYANESFYTFMEAIERNFWSKDARIVFKVDDKNKCNGVVSIGKHSYKLKVGKSIRTSDDHYNNTIYLNGQEVGYVSTNGGLEFGKDYGCDDASASEHGSGFYGIPYIAKLGEFVVIHFSINEGFQSYNMCLVLNSIGKVVDIFALNGFEEFFGFWNFNEPSQFRVKYKTLHKEKW